MFATPISINYHHIHNFYCDPNPLLIAGDTQNKIIRVVKQILSMMIFPIGIYNLLHAFAGKILIPVSSPSFISEELKNYLKTCVKTLKIPNTLLLKSAFQYKRFTVEIDGYQIDGCLLSNPLAKNRRWVLRSSGNAETYESTIVQTNYAFTSFLNSLNANGIVFNPPGVENSSGSPNKNITIKAYQTILTFLENQLIAEEIIGYGFSLGGGIQAEALRSHRLQEHIKYVFVKDRTFSDLSQVASIITGSFLGFLVKLLGWNMNPLTSSANLQATEIILQTAHVKKDFQELSNHNDLAESDGIIAKEASLAYSLLNTHSLKKKHILGITAGHNDSLTNTSRLIEIVKNSLQTAQNREQAS